MLQSNYCLSFAMLRIRLWLFCSVLFLLAVNSSAQTKREYVFRQGKLVAVTESCLFTLSTTDVSVPVEGTTGTVTVFKNAACDVDPESGASWINVEVVSGGVGTDSAVVSYTVHANPGDVRTGTITIGDQTVTISQAAHCQVLCPIQAQYCHSQSTVDGCQSSCEQKMIQEYPGCVDNPVGACFEWFQRCVSECIDDAEQACSQQYQQCTTSCNEFCSFSLSSTGASAPAAGTTGTVTVSSIACNWTAASNASWIDIQATSGTGEMAISYTVEPNTGPARTGTVTIAGKTFTVTQASGCSYSISPTSASVGSGAGSGAVNVTAGSGCTWTASSSDSWITITDCVVPHYACLAQYAASCPLDCEATILQQYPGCADNPGPCMQLFQECASQCMQQGEQTCNAQYQQCLASSRTGSGTVNYSVMANTGPARSGTLTIAGNTFTVTQALGCTYSISPSSTSVGSGGGGGTVSVTAGAGCTWTAVSNASWITVTGGSSGNGMERKLLGCCQHRIATQRHNHDWR